MVRSIRYSRPKAAPPELLIDFLCCRFPYLTRSAWEQHARDGHISVIKAARDSCGAGDNRHGVVVPMDYELQQNDEICFNPPRHLEPDINEHVVVLHSDEALLVCVKNGNLPVAEGGRYSANTLVGVLQRLAGSFTWETANGTAEVCLSKATNKETCGLKVNYYPVHRLDKETSGLVVLAKSADAARILSGQFERQSQVLNAQLTKYTGGESLTVVTSSQFDELITMDKSVSKSYIAVLDGSVPEGNEFIVCNRVGLLWEELKDSMKDAEKHTKLKKLKMACYHASVEKNQQLYGRPACSRIRILSSSDTLRVSVARVDILTGRTHQIRLHCAQIGFPVLGDKLYETSTPGAVGGLHAVADDIYLYRARETVSMSWGVEGMSVKRHLLHAAILTFTHPTTRERLEFFAAPHEWFLSDVECDEATKLEENKSGTEILRDLLDRAVRGLASHHFQEKVITTFCYQ
ncbi:RNA pseudouridylate synthase [Trypanosoma brucei equiperdum]|uniref:RNA pseudouridylate synthase n=1 Tax=Trypanosoma brucei equiperdum TaxID=630700 RepID=A0A3L6L6F8_9TRYP|nr:RNA pseudouridylate synthase [Trypanosoma brucei equiperdum]